MFSKCCYVVRGWMSISPLNFEDLHANRNLLYRQRSEDDLLEHTKTVHSYRTNKRKNKELLVNCGLDFIHFILQALRSNGETEKALIIEILRVLPIE